MSLAAAGTSRTSLNALLSPRGRTPSSHAAQGNYNFHSTFKRPFSQAPKTDCQLPANFGTTYGPWPKARAFPEFDAQGLLGPRRQAYPACKPFVKNVTLASGLECQVQSVDLKSGTSDAQALWEFYDLLVDSYSGVKGDRCSDRQGGVEYHARRQIEIAIDIEQGAGRVLALFAPVGEGGAPKVIGACMMSYSHSGGMERAQASRMLVGEGYRGLGVSLALKKAQMECAEADGASTMETFRALDEDMAGVYRKAGAESGMPIKWTTWGPQVDLRSGSRVPVETGTSGES